MSVQTVLDRKFRKKHLKRYKRGKVPWWKYAKRKEFEWQLARLRHALHFCKGRAADLRPHLKKHIEFLENLKRERV